MWILHTGDAEAEKRLIADGIPELAARVLSARKVRTPELARRVLDTSLDALPDPMLLADMPAAAARLRLALERGERIAVFGDYDVDGITATALLAQWLRLRGAACATFIPTRTEDGYGVTPQSVERLCAEGATLIITVDSGTAAHEAVSRARELGADVIITDHHECCGRIPAACAVVNPQRADCAHVGRELAGVGVAFMLALAVEGRAELERLTDMCGDLAAVGTIADVAPLIGMNRALVAAGIAQMRRAPRCGFRALTAETKIAPENIDSGAIGFSLAPRLNAAGRMGSASDALELLLTDDTHRAEQLARQLGELNRERQRTENELLEKVGLAAEHELRGGKCRRALVISGDGWYQGVVGIVAARLSERYARPAFLICTDASPDGVGKGSARSFYGVSILDVMRRASYLFESWGGHEFAAGFTIKKENIPVFRELAEELSAELPAPHIYADAVLDAAEITPELIDGLKILEPFGLANDPPLFIIRGVEIDSYVTVGWGHSARMTVHGGGRDFPAFCFGADPSALEICDGDRGDALCSLTVEERRGERRAALIVKGLTMPAEERRHFFGEMALLGDFKHGDRLSRDQAMLLLPRRGDFVAVLRHIRRSCSAGGTIVTNIGAMCRRIVRSERLDAGYARIMVCLDALAEAGKLRYDTDGEIINIEVLSDSPADLSGSRTLARLREMACNGRCPHPGSAAKADAARNGANSEERSALTTRRGNTHGGLSDS